jgi:hypothetical protein
MPGQRRTTGSRARGSWLPRLAGLGAVVLLAGAGVTAYLIVHPAAHGAAPLSPRVIGYQTVGLVVAASEKGSSTDQLVQLVSTQGTPTFSALGQAQAAQSSAPQWTADLMDGGSYIFIYLPTGQCLSAAATAGKPRLALRHCDLDARQRWRRTQVAVVSQAHDFYQYANLGDRSCVTQTGLLQGQIFGASLATCASSLPADQLIAFW